MMTIHRGGTRRPLAATEPGFARVRYRRPLARDRPSCASGVDPEHLVRGPRRPRSELNDSRCSEQSLDLSTGNVRIVESCEIVAPSAEPARVRTVESDQVEIELRGVDVSDDFLCLSCVRRMPKVLRDATPA